jgi:hypothetical protein
MGVGIAKAPRNNKRYSPEKNTARDVLGFGKLKPHSRKSAQEECNK